MTTVEPAAGVRSTGSSRARWRISRREQVAAAAGQHVDRQERPGAVPRLDQAAELVERAAGSARCGAGRNGRTSRSRSARPRPARGRGASGRRTGGRRARPTTNRPAPRPPPPATPGRRPSARRRRPRAPPRTIVAGNSRNSSRSLRSIAMSVESRRVRTSDAVDRHGRVGHQAPAAGAEHGPEPSIAPRTPSSSSDGHEPGGRQRRRPAGPRSCSRRARASRRPRTGSVAAEDPDAQHPEARASVVEPLRDRLGRPDVQVVERRRAAPAGRPGRSTSTTASAPRATVARRRRRPGRSAARASGLSPCCGLVDAGRVEPEGGVLGDEPAGPFLDPPFAEDQRLPAARQGLADARPFLEGDAAGRRAGAACRLGHGCHSTFGSRSIRSVERRRGAACPRTGSREARR